MAWDRRTWARVAGIMYLLVLVFDLSAMHWPRTPLGRSLMLTGSLLTVPLALGLYFTLSRFQPIVTRIALVCRLIEAFAGAISVLAGFETIRTALGHSQFGRGVLQLVAWDRSTSFGALVFTVGSTLFFFVFLRSGSLPAILSWLGLIASLLALGACIAHQIRPQFAAMSAPAWIPLLIAEITTGGWLAARGVGNFAGVQGRAD